MEIIIDKDYVEKVYKTAKEIFCNGIFVKCNDSHPCGWDFISFKYMEDFEENITTEQISNGCYNYHQYDGFSLLEILKEVGEDGWCFEIYGTTNW